MHVENSDYTSISKRACDRSRGLIIPKKVSRSWRYISVNETTPIAIRDSPGVRGMKMHPQLLSSSLLRAGEAHSGYHCQKPPGRWCFLLSASSKISSIFLPCFFGNYRAIYLTGIIFDFEYDEAFISFFFFLRYFETVINYNVGNDTVFAWNLSQQKRPVLCFLKAGTRSLVFPHFPRHLRALSKHPFIVLASTQLSLSRYKRSPSVTALCCH